MAQSKKTVILIPELNGYLVNMNTKFNHEKEILVSDVKSSVDVFNAQLFTKKNVETTVHKLKELGYEYTMSINMVPFRPIFAVEIFISSDTSWLGDYDVMPKVKHCTTGGHIVFPDYIKKQYTLNPTTPPEFQFDTNGHYSNKFTVEFTTKELRQEYIDKNIPLLKAQLHDYMLSRLELSN